MQRQRFDLSYMLSRIHLSESKFDYPFSHCCPCLSLSISVASQLTTRVNDIMDLILGGNGREGSRVEIHGSYSSFGCMVTEIKTFKLRGVSK